MKNKKPLIICFQGMPATGKTYFAKKISKVFEIPRIDRDDIKSKIIKIFKTGKDPYCDEMKFRYFATGIFLDCAQKSIKKHKTIILEGLIPKAEILDFFYKYFPTSKYQIIQIKLYNSNIKLWKKRFCNRIPLANQSKYNFKTACIDFAKKLISLQVENQIKIDSSKDEKENLEKIIKFAKKYYED